MKEGNSGISTTFIGYHGTSGESASLIIETGFTPSKNHDDWLGHGVYFFINGISCPKSNAEKWAKNQAWDNDKKYYKYKAYSVIQAKVDVQKSRLLDLTTTDGLEVFNTIRELLINELQQHFFVRGRDVNDDDQKICNHAISHLKLELLISHFYIKNQTQRTKNIVSKIPNTTVMLVVKPELCNISSIKQVKTGVIK
jgi:hypothetical protein